MAFVEISEPVAYNIAQLVRVFGQPRRVVERMIRDGTLPARRLPDGRLVVLRDELLEALRSLPRP